MIESDTVTAARFRTLSLLAFVAMVGCSPVADKVARETGMDQLSMPGFEFNHMIYMNKSYGLGRRLHVYIEGDGRPWITDNEPAADPTPVDPIALRLMAVDNGAAAYVGRPCYFGRAQDAGCGPMTWTFERYSESVIDSMVAATARLAADGGYGDVVLIGYSGGGAVALLMAPRMPAVVGVLTVAANLDIDAWVRVHGYLPLAGSLNPAVTSLGVERLHVAAVGGKDDVVPQSVTEAYIKRGHDPEVWQFPEFDHVCCWVDVWPELLERFEATLDGSR